MKKVISLLCLLCSLFTYSQPLTIGNGWNDDEGGLTKSFNANPWFMGDNAYRFCIDHAGEDIFSLPKKDAIRIISEVFTDFTTDIGKYKYGSPSRYLGRFFEIETHGLSSLRFNPEDASWRYVEDFKKNDEGWWLSDLFILDENCEDDRVYDFKIVLGNINDPIVTEFKNHVGTNLFDRVGAYAIKSDYDSLLLRAKGVLYFAPDLGPHRYKGTVNKFYPRDDIEGTFEENGQPFWSNANYFSEAYFYSKDVKGFAPVLKDDIVDSGVVSYKDFFDGPFKGILLHEVGHMYGFKHGANEVMESDYPERAIAIGLTPKASYESQKKFLSRTLVNYLPTKIGFEAFGTIRKMELVADWLPNKIKKKIAILFEEGLKDDPNNMQGHIVFEVDRTPQGDVLSTDKLQGTINIKVLSDSLKEYTTVKSFPYNYVDDSKCEPTLIPFGKESTEVEINYPLYPTHSRSYDFLSSIPLITLKEETICGEIELSKFKKLNFIIRFNASGRIRFTWDNMLNTYMGFLYNIDSGEADSEPIINFYWNDGVNKKVGTFL